MPNHPRGLKEALRLAGRLNADGVRQHWKQLRPLLSAAEIEGLAVIGFISLLNDMRHGVRQDVPATSDYEVVVVQNGGPTETLLVFTQVSYEAADGTIKLVAYFTKDDCRYAAQHMRREAAGMRAKADWMDDAARMLTRYRKPLLKDLPVKIQVELAHRFQRLEEAA